MEVKYRELINFTNRTTVVLKYRAIYTAHKTRSNICCLFEDSLSNPQYTYV